MLSSYELFGFMSPTLATEILNWAYDEDKPLYKASLASVANARRVRPVFLQRQPRPQRHATMLGTLSRPGQDTAAGSLLRSWLLKKYNAMLCDFLDALDIEHEEGVVEELPETVEEEKLKSGISLLLEKYPPEVVSVYLNAFNGMNETDWPTLQKMLEEDSRLQLGG